MLKKSLVAVCLFGAFVAFVGCGDDKEETPAGGGGAGGAGGTSSAAFSCAAWCEAGASLKCEKASSCLSDCEEAFAQYKAVTACKAKLDELATCLAGLKADSLECDTDGTLAPKSSKCGAESLAFGLCAASASGGASGSGVGGSAGNAGAAGDTGTAGDTGMAGGTGMAGTAGTAGAGG